MASNWNDKFEPIDKYNTTKWQNNVTPINQTNLNKIENGIDNVTNDHILLADKVNEFVEAQIDQNNSLYDKITTVDEHKLDSVVAFNSFIQSNSDETQTINSPIKFSQEVEFVSGFTDSRIDNIEKEMSNFKGYKINSIKEEMSWARK